MAVEIAPFGLGVTRVHGRHLRHRDHHRCGHHAERHFGGAYARLHNTMNTRGRFAMRMARPPEKFTDGVVKALADTRSFRRRGVGPDKSMLLVSGRNSGHRYASHVPDRARHTQAGLDAGRGVAGTTAQKAMVLAAKVIPQPCCNASRRWLKRARELKGKG